MVDRRYLPGDGRGKRWRRQPKLNVRMEKKEARISSTSSLQPPPNEGEDGKRDLEEEEEEEEEDLLMYLWESNSTLWSF